MTVVRGLAYQGGKGRIAGPIVDVMLAGGVDPALPLVEPFLGGASVTAALAAKGFADIRASDDNASLVMMWEHALAGGTFPETLTEAEYEAAREAPPSALRGFIGAGGSFGGGWFNGYARSSTGRRYIAEASRAVARTAEALRGKVSLACTPYAAVKVPPGAALYLDPPYGGTKSYKGARPFDTARFWRWAETYARIGHRVYVSEFSAPWGWKVAAEYARTSTMAGSGQAVVERLFTR